MLVKKILSFTAAVLFSISVFAQSDVSKYEMRGIWMASVTNLDWPESGNASVESQKADLIEKLDKLKAAGINLVFFQVRNEGDALYDSEIEPWSRYLTGTEGEAPDPYWDPLEFAIEEAHKRGMELHAWLNPYRAMITVPSDFTQKRAFSPQQEIDEHLRSFLAKEQNLNAPFYKRDTDQRDEMHVSNTHPEWLLVVNNFAIFNPGLPEVMDYTTEVVMDIVNRYDIDGIHFDDYFYPYPDNHMESSDEINALDDDTFAEYPRGFDNKADWRRNNINMMVEMVYDSINTVKPWVEFGISPFGIWRAGTPPGIYGMSSVDRIYADALAWLESQTIDYINPQLYWRVGGNQDFIRLSNWWAEKAAENNRHMYAGHGVYKTDRSTFANALFSANEIPKQIRHTRQNEDIDGSIFFRAKNITNYSTKGFADSLKNDFYKYAALPPIMDWKDQTAPATPQNLMVERDTETEYIFKLNWDEVDFIGADVPGSTHQDTVLRYAVYRVDSSIDPNEADAMTQGSNLIAVTGETSYTDVAPPSANEFYYFVTAVSRNSIESEPSESVNAGTVLAGNISLTPEHVFIDSTMEFTPDYTILNVDNEEEYVSRSTINWSVTNPEVGEISETGTFTPLAAGETEIIATLNVVSDTIQVKVTEHEGYFTIDNFADFESWNLEADNLDENQIEVTADPRGGVKFSYTIPANTSDVQIRLQKNIPIDGVPSFANIKTSGDSSGVEITLDISNADGQFRMSNSETVDFAAPDVIHYPFRSSQVEQLTSGAAFYFPFILESVNIKIPDNDTDEAIAGYFNLFEVGVSYTETPVSNELDEITEVPVKMSLDQNYPNPFNPTTNISFNLPNAEQVTLSVFDIIGREVATIVDGRLTSGAHTYTFDASNLSSGIYLYRLKSQSMTLTRKMTLIK